MKKWNSVEAFTIEYGVDNSYQIDFETDNMWAELGPMLEDIGMVEENTITKKVGVNETGGTDYELRFN